MQTMLSKCLQCNFIRNQIYIKSFRTSSYIFDESQQKSTPKPKQKTLFDAIKQHTKNVLIEFKPEKESVQTLLRVQKVTHEISADFKMIYKFPYIHYFGLINRLKIYQTVISIAASIGVAGLGAMGIISSELVTATIGVAMSGCLFFHSLGFVTARFIGIIYFNENTNMIQIAYVDFWGRRRDVQMPVNDIIPRTELPESKINKVWHPLVRYSSKEILKLQLQIGKTFDLDALNKIL
ncbi:transmembrane protein 186 isoform X2 [Euwallacea fornicatus]|uniref:transmembrane protein 186 isoform X2 n=1 Tax=Euwallacea fornicatus TaxID=995702 RepID=UPI00338F7C74